MLIYLLDPSFWSLDSKKSDHGGPTVVVVELFDFPLTGLNHRGVSALSAKHEKLASEKSWKQFKIGTFNL